ncbi:MAG: type II CAAX endopeptidase family protein [Myxococcaceae bacterium]
MTRLIEWLKPYLRELGGEATVIMIASSALLVVSHYQGATGYFRVVTGTTFDTHPAQMVLSHLWWFCSALVLYMPLPLLIAYGTKGSFNRSYGLRLGDWRAGLKIAGLLLAVMLPAVFIASRLKAFEGQYPLAGPSAYTLRPQGKPEQLSWTLFLVYEAGYMAYFIGWEFFFRGWMLNGLLPRFGRAGAILIQMAPFAIMHLGKAELEALGSIIAGIALGVLALRTRSFWYGALLHMAVALWMDCLVSIPHLLAGK